MFLLHHLSKYILSLYFQKIFDLHFIILLFYCQIPDYCYFLIYTLIFFIPIQFTIFNCHQYHPNNFFLKIQSHFKCISLLFFVQFTIFRFTFYHFLFKIPCVYPVVYNIILILNLIIILIFIIIVYSNFLIQNLWA